MTGVTEEGTVAKFRLLAVIRGMVNYQGENSRVVEREKKEVVATTAAAREIHLFNQRHSARYKREWILVRITSR